MPMPSREELFGKVQDLCTHGFGPRLYRELIVFMDQAALACVSRLQSMEAAAPAPVGSSSSAGGSVNDNDTGNGHHNSAPKYPTRNCAADSSGDRIYFTSLEEERSGSGEGSIVLQNVWEMYSDYLQFLNCVRSIFLTLDRMFLYLPPGIGSGAAVGGDGTGTLLPRNANGSIATAVASIVRTQNENGLGNNHNTGVVGESLGSMDLNATVAAAWDMWDVGMHCLWKHLSLSKDQGVAIGSATSDADAKMECSAAAAGRRISVLDALKARTIQCMVAELDLLRENNSNADVQMSTPGAEQQDITTNTNLLHKSLVRNSVSIFRSLAHVSIVESSNSNATSTNTNVNKDLLQDLVQEIITYFQNESLNLISDSGSSSSAPGPSKTSYDASFIIRHIVNRRNQVNSMTTYYHLANDTLADSSPTENRNISMNGMDAPSQKRPNRILIDLVEKYLLSPHFTPQLLLHPSNLYPILDNDQENIHTNSDAKHLYELSQYVVQTSPHSSTYPSSSFSAILSSPGTELFRQAFEAYGKERGTAIMRSASVPLLLVASSAGSIASGGGSSGGGGKGKSKPPPQMTMREMNHKIVVNLLQFKAHLEYLLAGAFRGNEFFGKTCRKVLEDVLNNTDVEGTTAGSTPNQNDDLTRRRSKYRGNDSDGGKRIAELLAKYMDLRFKNVKTSLPSPIKGVGGRIAGGAGGGNTEDDVESFQDGVMGLFRHIQSKDVFEAFYRQDLSKRLLLNKSASIDAERSFVSKLKAECGTGYTSKMEGMFNDMELSKDVMSSYSAHLMGLASSGSASVSASSSASGSGKIQMEVQVLTTGYWPAHTQYPSLIFSEVLQNKRDEFEVYYKKNYQGRRITWQNGLGNCIVRAYFPKISGPRELNVSLCQALVLLCFNLGSEGEDVRLTLGDIMQKVGISDKGEAERVLQSLSMGRDGTQVLRRVESSGSSRDNNSSDNNANTDATPRKKHKSSRKAISDQDLFAFNENFISNQRRIRITNIQMKETASDRKKTHESVILDRLHLTDAAIVRIMKARKTLEHRDLVAETMNQLKFPASGVEVKKRIESLIDREYLERVEGDSSRYNYLA